MRFSLASLVLVLAALVPACAADSTEPDGAEDAESDDSSAISSAPSSFQAASQHDRQAVYDAVKGHAHAASDLLNEKLTDGRLVDAIGWLVDHDAPSFTISAIRTDHHNDGQAAHAGGHAVDMYTNDFGDIAKLVALVDQDPFVHEIGLGGQYKTQRKLITHKEYFNDNKATHVHIGVIQAFGR